MWIARETLHVHVRSRTFLFNYASGSRENVSQEKKCKKFFILPALKIFVFIPIHFKYRHNLSAIEDFPRAGNPTMTKHVTSELRKVAMMVKGGNLEQKKTKITDSAYLL